MQTEATRQADNITPPRQGEVIPLAIDGTSRAYDTAAITIAGSAYRPGQNDHAYLTLYNAGTETIYFVFAPPDNVGQPNCFINPTPPATAIDDTQILAAGSTLAYAKAYCFPLLSQTAQDMRFHRDYERYLIVKCPSGQTSTLYLYASSQNTYPRGQGA
jgi:hypothetical protein